MYLRPGIGRCFRNSQAQRSKDGQTRLIGQTLLELGLVSKETLDQAITEQIIQLQSALQQANSELEARVRERTKELENALTRLTEFKPVNQISLPIFRMNFARLNPYSRLYRIIDRK